MPKVSVIIPSFNHEKFIAEAINSLLNQTFQDFEIIITDDASTDNTVDEIKKINDSRIKLFINQSNQGAVATTNNCIRYATGQYIAVLNSDDIWKNNKLEEQIKFIESNPNYSAIFSQAYIIDENNNEIIDDNSYYYDIFNKENRSRFEWLNYFFNNGNCLCHPSVLIKKSIYDEVGLYNELMANLPDFDMWIRICLKYEIYVIPEKLVSFRILNDLKNASSLTPGNAIRIQFENKQLLNHFLSIENVDFFKKIFPSCSYYGNVDNKEDILFILSRIAIDSKYNFMQLWGLELLYTRMVNKEKYEYINKKFSFSYKDFFQLTQQKDIFNLYKVSSNFDNLYVEIFYVSSKKDFNENNKQSLIFNKKNKYLTFEFDGQQITKIRFDPLNIPCKIRINSILVENLSINLKVPVSYRVLNGYSKEDYFLFDNDDSQVLIEPGKVLSGHIKVNIDIEYFDVSETEVKDQVLNIIKNENGNLLNKNQDLYNQNQNLLDENQDLYNQNQDLYKSIDNIKNTISWRITKPLRFIKRFI